MPHVHRDERRQYTAQAGSTGPPGSEREETTHPGVPRWRAQWSPVVIRLTGLRVPCAPPASGLDPAPGGGPSWPGKTAIPGMPCHGAPAYWSSRAGERVGLKRCFSSMETGPPAAGQSYRRTDGLWGETAGPVSVTPAVGLPNEGGKAVTAMNMKPL